MSDKIIPILNNVITKKLGILQVKINKNITVAIFSRFKNKFLEKDK